MRIAVVTAFMLLALQSKTENVLIQSVIDGNTIEVAGYGRLQLAGIKAPVVPRNRRVAPDPIAHDARQRLDVILTRRFARLEFVRRTAVYVLLDDGTFVNALLAREGLARVTARPSDPHYKELDAAESEAKRLHRGLWTLR